VSVYLVRHAKAGSRAKWNGEDWQRPLSTTGHLQAAAISDRLAGEGIKTLWSSPYVRCVQTLEPLAERVGLVIGQDDRLAEGAQFDDTLALMSDAGDGAVFCTHGDVLSDVVNALVRRGTELTTEPEWRKGSVWTLDNGRATAEPPLEV
jgi:8-oxo-dGTP diphosphatase